MSISCQKDYSLTIGNYDQFYWKLDELGTPASVVDSINGLSLTPFALSGATTGPSSVAGIISGGQRMVQLLQPFNIQWAGELGFQNPVSMALAPKTPGISISMWFNSGSFFAGSASATGFTVGFQPGWDIGGNSPADFGCIRLMAFYQTQTAAVIYTSGSSVFAAPTLTSGVLALNQWHHVVGVVNASALTLTLYVDGVLISTTSLAPSVAPHNTITISRIANEPPLFHYSSDYVVIDECGFWNGKVLSLSDVQQMWNGGVGARPPGVP